MSLPFLLGLACQPVVVIGILSMLGAASVYFGVLSKQETSALAKVNFYLFIPGLSFSQLASTLSFTKVLHLWPLIANMCISILMGLFLGFIVQKIVRVDASLRNLVIVCMGFRNVGNLPMVFIPSLCSAGLFESYFNEDECTRMGYSYIAMDIAIANILQFTIAISLLSNLETEAEDMMPLFSDGDIELTESTEIVSLHRTETISREIQNENSGLVASTSGMPKIPWRQMFPVPTQVAIAGVIVACIPPAKSIVCSETLSPILDSLAILGQGMVPATVPLLGAVLMTERQGNEQSMRTGSPILGPVQMGVIVLVELFILPWILCGIAIFFFQIGLYKHVDPVFVFVMFLANSSPSAIILLSLSILYKNRPETMSRILLYSYSAALVLLPLNTTFYLKILSHMFD